VDEGAALLRELAPANETHPAGLSASTLYRFLHARGLTERQLLLDQATAHKKYEAQFANQIWQSDMLFGPWVGRPGGGKQQVFLQAALDDASRLIPHAQFYPNQGLDAFLDCLRQAIAARGIPTRLYMDNAMIYRSPQLARIAWTPSITGANTARSRPRRSCAGSAISNRFASFPRPPIYAVCSSIAWTGWCAAIPLSC
jgi:transposase InsO family protein